MKQTVIFLNMYAVYTLIILKHLIKNTTNYLQSAK